MSEYAPEEIMVKTVDNKLLVHAKHEEVGVVVSFNQLESSKMDVDQSQDRKMN